MNIIETLEQEEIARLGKTIPEFAPGDTVIVNVSVVEGERKRVQAYEGVVIAKRNRGLNSGVHRAQDLERRRRRAHVPDVFAADRVDRGEAQGRRAPRQALLPARPLRQVGAHPRKARAHSDAAQGASDARPALRRAARRCGSAKRPCAGRFSLLRRIARRAVSRAGEPGRMARFLLCRLVTAGGIANRRFHRHNRGSTARPHAHEGNAVRSARHPSHVLRRGGAGGAAPRSSASTTRRRATARATSRKRCASSITPAASCPTPSGARATTRSSRVSTGTTEQRIAHVVTNAVAETGEQTDVGTARAGRARRRRMRSTTSSTPGSTPDEPDVDRSHHPGLTERVASFGRSPIVTIGLCALFGAFIAAAIVFVTPADTILVAQAGAGVADAHAARRSRSSTASCTASRTCAGAAARAQLGARAADRSRDPQLAAREERVPRHQPAAGGRELDLPAAHGRARAREVGPHERAAAVASPGRAHLRLRDLGTRARAAAVGAARRSASCPASIAYWLGHPLLAPVLITRDLGPDRGAAHRLARHDARQVAVRRLPAVLDLRRVRAPRHARAARRAACARAFRVWWEGVGCGFPLLAPVLIAVAYEKLAQNQETDWDFAQDVPRHARPARRAQHGDRRVRPRRDAVALRRRVAPADGRVDRVGAHDASPRRCRRRRGSTGNFAADAGRIGILPSAPRCRRRRARERAAAPAPRRRVDAAPRRRAEHDVARRAARIDPDVSTLHRRAPRAHRGAAGRRSAHAARRQLAARRRAVPRVDRARARERATRSAASGRRMQAQGYHQDAINAFRKAKQYDPQRPLARRRDRPRAARHRRRLPEPLPALTRRGAHADQRASHSGSVTAASSVPRRDQQRDRRAGAVHLHREDVRRRRRRHGGHHHRDLPLERRRARAACASAQRDRRQRARASRRSTRRAPRNGSVPRANAQPGADGEQAERQRRGRRAARARVAGSAGTGMRSGVPRDARRRTRCTSGLRASASQHARAAAAREHRDRRDVHDRHEHADQQADRARRPARRRARLAAASAT